MSPRPSRICSVLDCGRPHHGKGFCRVHYGRNVQKPERLQRSAKQASETAQTTNPVQSVGGSR